MRTEREREKNHSLPVAVELRDVIVTKTDDHPEEH